MSRLVGYAESELKAAGLFDKESDYDGMLGGAVLELIKTFSEQGHSGSSASMAISLFSRLANFKPLSPLTLKDDEWLKFSDVYQNTRNSSVFKKGVDGKPYNIDAFFKKNQRGSTYSGSLKVGDGRVIGRCYIKDPSCMPEIAIDIIDWEVNKETGEKEAGSGWWEEKMKDVSQLDELSKYYELELKEIK